MLAGVIVASVCTAFLYRRQTRSLEAGSAAAQQRLAELASASFTNMRTVRIFAGEALEQRCVGRRWAGWLGGWGLPCELRFAARLAAAPSLGAVRAEPVALPLCTQAGRRRFGQQVARSYNSGVGFARAKATLESELRGCRGCWEACSFA